MRHNLDRPIPFTIPYHPQENEYFCGPAVVQMALGYFGITAAQADIAAIAHTNETVGTSTTGLVEALSHFGLSTRAGEHKALKDIAAALSKKRLPIVCFTEPEWKWGHFAVVGGLGEHSIHLSDPDPDNREYAMDLSQFLPLWKDDVFTHTTRWLAIVSR